MELHVIEREGRETVVLLDNEMRIVKPVYDYLKFQRQKDKALNTLKASGSDLRTYWEFLNDNGYEYDKVTPKMIAEFIDYLRASDDDVIALNKESKRTNKTINRILSTIHMFYQFEADMQEIDNPILMHDVNRPFNSFKGILEHAKSDNKTKQSIFKVIIHKVFINDIVKDAIAELSEYTAELRKESGLKELFLCRIKSQNNRVALYTLTHWNDKKLRFFIERHDIRDNKGNLYPLTSHQFRATFVRELIKRKVPIAMIMKQYSHVSIEMTAHYLTLQEEEVKEIYSDMILSPESKIAGLRAKEIKGNRLKS